jgi:hypothetical protein
MNRALFATVFPRMRLEAAAEMVMIPKSLGLLVSAIAAATVLFAEPAHAQSASTSSFNHFLTGFPLTGTHASVACASCHVNGRMKNTPTQCIGCHNTMTAPGEPQSHPKTTNRCENCHLTSTWRDMAFMDHVQATGTCASCHNGTLALGKSANHIVTAAPCGDCHHNTVSFAGATLPAGPPASNSAASLATTPPVVAATPAPLATNKAQPNTSHVGVSNRCASCHNGVTASGKPPNHAATNAPCESCHKSTVSFVGARMNHAGVIGNCASCHDGRAAIGKPTNHVITNASCETCHKSTATFEGARLDHTRVTATCAGCHNGTVSEGKPARHFVTTLPCESCHRTVTWISPSYRHASPAYVNHGPGSSCTSCHTTNAQTVLWKFPASRPDCAGCHADKYRPQSHPKFMRPAAVYYTITELRDCTGACHIFTDNTQKAILTRRFGVHRSMQGGW